MKKSHLIVSKLWILLGSGVILFTGDLAKSDGAGPFNPAAMARFKDLLRPQISTSEVAKSESLKGNATNSKNKPIDPNAIKEANKESELKKLDPGSSLKIKLVPKK